MVDHEKVSLTSERANVRDYQLLAHRKLTSEIYELTEKLFLSKFALNVLVQMITIYFSSHDFSLTKP